MKESRTDRVFLGVSLGGFLLLSVSFLLMPLESMTIIPGLLFWGGLVVGIAFQIVLEVRRRAFFAAYNVRREKMQKPRNGFLTFGSNQAAIIADFTLAVSGVAAILTYILTKGSGYICFFLIAIVLLSFFLHCILNGRNYFYINHKTKIRQVLEQRKGNIAGKGERKK